MLYRHGTSQTSTPENVRSVYKLINSIEKFTLRIIYNAGEDLNNPIMTVRVAGDDDNSPATTAGPNTAIGRRNAYHDVVKSQLELCGTCNITLFSLLSSYSIAKHKEPTKKKAGSPQITPLQILLELDADSGTTSIHCHISNYTYISDLSTMIYRHYFKRSSEIFGKWVKILQAVESSGDKYMSIHTNKQ